MRPNSWLVFVVAFLGVLALLNGSEAKVDQTPLPGFLLWGKNEQGQLLVGDVLPQKIPVYIEASIPEFNGSEWATVSIGADFLTASMNDGKMASWGTNTAGQLGTGFKSSSEAPKALVFLNEADAAVTQFVWVANTLNSATGLTNEGILWSWGNNGNGQLGYYDNITESLNPIPVNREGPLNNTLVNWVGCGELFCVAMYNDSNSKVRLATWGDNSYGQLGFNSGNIGSVYVPAAVNTTGEFGQEAIKQVSVGATHVVVLMESGNLWAWGDGAAGQLGNGNDTQSSWPVKVSLVSPDPIIQVVSGRRHVLALTQNGTLYGWGQTSRSQLGPVEPFPAAFTPIAIPLGWNFGRLLTIGAVKDTSFAYSAKLRLYGWGAGDNHLTVQPGDLNIPLSLNLTDLPVNYQINYIISSGVSSTAAATTKYVESVPIDPSAPLAPEDQEPPPFSIPLSPSPVNPASPTFLPPPTSYAVTLQSAIGIVACAAIVVVAILP